MTVPMRPELIFGPRIRSSVPIFSPACPVAQSITMSPSATEGSCKGLTPLPPAPVPTTSVSTTQPTASPPTPARAPRPPPLKSNKHHTTPLDPDVLHVAPYQSSPQQLPLFLIGISGPPSSDRTALSNALAKLFPAGTISLIFDEDDYMLLSKSSATPDAGSGNAMKCDQLVRVLKELKENGKLPSGSKSLCVSGSGALTAEHLVKPETVGELGEVAEKLRLVLGNRKIGIVEGLLPYADPLLRDLLNVKLLLPVSKSTAKQDCLAKFGHLPSTGKDYRQAWEYFENVEWPKYTRVHSDLFRHGDVEGSVKKHVCRQLEIDVPPQLGSMEILKWAVDAIVRESKANNERSNPNDNIEDPNDQYDFCRSHNGVLGRVRQFLFDLL